jgi:hypothetical protein
MKEVAPAAFPLVLGGDGAGTVAAREQNMKTKLIIYALATLTLINGTQAQSRAGNAVPVNPDNFIRAESDLYFGKIVKDGSFGKFTHNRELTPIDKQLVVRTNRDTLFPLRFLILMRGPSRSPCLMQGSASCQCR